MATHRISSLLRAPLCSLAGFIAANGMLADLQAAELAPQPLDSGAAARGEVLYRQICFTCHGADLRGGIGTSLLDPYWKHGDSAEAIVEVLEKGIPDSNMVSFAGMFPKEDRLALAEFLLSKQEGPRHLVRRHYPPQDGELTLDSLAGLKPTKVQPHPENLIYFNKNFDGASHLESTLFIQEAGNYRFHFKDKGKTKVYINGTEVYRFDEAAGVNEQEAFRLEPGRYQLDILHQEPKVWHLIFSGHLQSEEGREIALFGKSLDGAEPKVHRASPVARLFRKRVSGLSSKSLIVFLPNGVIVALNSDTGGVEKAWSKAELDQTPSVSARSATPSVINGTPLPRSLEALAGKGHRVVLESTRMQGEAITFGFRSGSRPVSLTVSPVGTDGYRLAVGSERPGPDAPALFPNHEFASPPDASGNFTVEVAAADSPQN